MIDFITLQTNIHDRRKVSISYSDSNPETCYLLGNLIHNTEFNRADLVTFARDVLAAFGNETDADTTQRETAEYWDRMRETDAETDDLLERVARNSKRSRTIADGGNHDKD